MVVKGLEGCTVEILIENDVVIVLWHKTFQSEVLCHEPDQLRAGTVIRKLVRQHTFKFEHGVKELLPVTPSLHLAINVEIQDAKWLNFDQVVAARANEQFLVADFDKPDALGAIALDEARVVVGRQL